MTVLTSPGGDSLPVGGVKWIDLSDQLGQGIVFIPPVDDPTNPRHPLDTEALLRGDCVEVRR